ncbi:glycosyltransferase [Demequina lignilytica]|uniref:glycosyltransferase n=1 Tax=Demequina lignilytica TaxID=3051663 RepID=UPI00345E7E96
MPVAASRRVRTSSRFIWGPVGGATQVPHELRRFLPWQSRLFEHARTLTGEIGRRLFARRTARDAALVVAQNSDAAAALQSVSRALLIEPNVLVPPGLIGPSNPIRSQEILGVGRLVAWKGWELAIRAMVELPPAYSLRLVGEGPEAERLAALARELGVDDRVRLDGPKSREEVLELMAGAACLVHPSLHDSAAGVLGEAIESGCPVVAFDVGGSGTILRESGLDPVSLTGSDVVADLAAALLEARPPLRSGRWSSSRLPLVLAEWLETAYRKRA